MPTRRGKAQPAKSEPRDQRALLQGDVEVSAWVAFYAAALSSDSLFEYAEVRADEGVEHLRDRLHRGTRLPR